jgi:hypothetical protein
MNDLNFLQVKYRARSGPERYAACSPMIPLQLVPYQFAVFFSESLADTATPVKSCSKAGRERRM